MNSLKTIHSQIEELEISEETARALYRVYLRGDSKDWEKHSLARIQGADGKGGEANREANYQRNEISDAMMDYMSGSSFDYPLEDIISIKYDAEMRLRSEFWTIGNQFQFANKNLLINTLQQAETRHLRYQVS
jgi:hypothetical protein